MKQSGKVLLLILAALVVVGGGLAILIHLHLGQSQLANLPHAVAEHVNGAARAVHGAPEPAAGNGLDAGSRLRAGVEAIGRRWDEEAFARTVALYTEAHRELEWPGLLAPETIAYGPDARQSFVLYRPEQEFSEPGPVFVFVHGNGLGTSELDAPGSDGLIWSHFGKLAATFGGIGLLMDYRSGPAASAATGAEDIRLVIEWVTQNVSAFGGDPDTIVVIGNSEGATNVAAYLFNESWQTAEGPKIAAAFLSSGLFGRLAPEIMESAIAYKGERVPLALWVAEYDTAAVAEGVADLHELLCRKYGGCPWYEQIPGHNHLSAIMSLGTEDADVQNRMIRFYHTVR